MEMADGRTIVFLDQRGHERDLDADYAMELFYRAGDERREIGTAYRHFGLATRELDAILARLAERDVEPRWFKQTVAEGSSEVRVCFVVDPDGYEIELLGP